MIAFFSSLSISYKIQQPVLRMKLSNYTQMSAILQKDTSLHSKQNKHNSLSHVKVISNHDSAVVKLAQFSLIPFPLLNNFCYTVLDSISFISNTVWQTVIDSDPYSSMSFFIVITFTHSHYTCSTLYHNTSDHLHFDHYS